jgi:uncharacterized damage-inducible protein DinB
MSLAAALLPEFDHEMANTRKALERVPFDRFDWKPHPKSPTLGWLAGHVANIPSWTEITLTQDALDINPPGQKSPSANPPKSREELLAAFDKNRDKARKALESVSDAEFGKPWSLLSEGKVVFTQPRPAVLRGFVMNHMIHHRAQLGVYLRMNDVPVPALYGPSADESPF